jgi:hypothetical protein
MIDHTGRNLYLILIPNSVTGQNDLTQVKRTVAYSSVLKIEATCSSETPVDFQQTTRPYIQEDRTLHNRRFENLKSYVGYEKSDGRLFVWL